MLGRLVVWLFNLNCHCHGAAFDVVEGDQRAKVIASKASHHDGTVGVEFALGMRGKNQLGTAQ